MNDNIIIKVVAALISKEDKILIARRSTGDSVSLGKWEFPGGKVEKNETEEDAIEREIKEEFEIIIKAKEFIFNNIFEYPNKTINLMLYNCEYISGTMQLHDHFEYRWINIDEFKKYDLAEADIPLAHYIMEKSKVLEKKQKI